MSDELYKVSVDEVVGPLPNGRGMIVLKAGDKKFPVICPNPDAASCYCHLYESPLDSPYEFVMSSLYDVAGIEFVKAEIKALEDELYAVLDYKSKMSSVPIRHSTGNLGRAVNVCLATGSDSLLLPESLYDRIVDSSNSLLFLRREIGRLWPLPVLSSTSDLCALDSYLEESMPNGSILGNRKDARGQHS